jgi:hypothetical protein
MARLILLDQLRLTVLVPAVLPDQQARQVSRRVNAARFRCELLQALRAVFRQHPELTGARVQLTG